MSVCTKFASRYGSNRWIMDEGTVLHAPTFALNNVIIIYTHAYHHPKEKGGQRKKEKKEKEQQKENNQGSHMQRSSKLYRHFAPRRKQ